MLDTSGLDTSGLDTSGLDTSGLNTNGLNNKRRESAPETTRPGHRSPRARRSAQRDSSYWMHQFRCSARELAQAVKAVGDDPLDVGVYLERR